MTNITKRKLMQLLKQPFSRAGDEFGNIGDVVNSMSTDSRISESLISLTDKAIAISGSAEEFFSSLGSLIKTYPNLSRNEFLKIVGTTGLVALYLTQTSCIGGPSAASIKKDRARLEDITWDANPIIPIPNEGCYTGFHQNSWIYSDEINAYVDDYFSFTKKLPTFWTPGRYYMTCANDYFPLDGFEALKERGIIPCVLYKVEPIDFKGIVNGKFDEDIISFAKQVKEFDFPILFTPYPEINVRANHVYFVWGNHKSKDIRNAWRHMHNIFDDVGANKNTIWGIHFIDSSISRDPKPFDWLYPGDEYVDWVGFSVIAGDWQRTSGFSFDSLFSGTYEKAIKMFPNKPVAIFEMHAQKDYQQPKWIRNAFKSIKENYPAVKLVLYFNSGSTRGLSDLSKKAYSGAISDKYFISSILPQKK